MRTISSRGGRATVLVLLVVGLVVSGAALGHHHDEAEVPADGAASAGPCDGSPEAARGSDALAPADSGAEPPIVEGCRAEPR